MLQSLVNIFHIVLYQPLFNALILLYEYIPGHDFGIAIIILTIIVRVIFYPLAAKSIKSQKAMSELQPKLKEIKKKYKNNKEKEMKAIVALYKESDVNPVSGCLPVLIQLPILIALYRVFWRGFQPDSMRWLYDFISNPGVINPVFLGFLRLDKPEDILAIIAGILQYIQVKMTLPKISASEDKNKDKKIDFTQIIQTQMVYFYPLFTVYILSSMSPWKLPSAIALYWIVTTAFAIGQQRFIFAKKKKELIDTKR